MKTNSIRNLLFDLGNVIVDLDIQLANEKLQKLLRTNADKGKIDKALLDYECGKISTDIFINTIISQSHHNVQAFDVIEAWNSMLVGIPSYRLEMLRMLLESYNVYLLSNTNELHLDWIHKYVLRSYGVRDFEKEHFHEAYYSHRIGDRKPMPSIFKYVIDDAFMTPGLTLYMDDLKDNIAVADKMGFKTFLVKPGVEITEYLKVEGFF